MTQPCVRKLRQVQEYLDDTVATGRLLTRLGFLAERLQEAREAVREALDRDIVMQAADVEERDGSGV